MPRGDHSHRIPNYFTGNEKIESHHCASLDSSSRLVSERIGDDGEERRRRMGGNEAAEKIELKIVEGGDSRHPVPVLYANIHVVDKHPGDLHLSQGPGERLELSPDGGRRYDCRDGIRVLHRDPSVEVAETRSQYQIMEI